ncbi:MAG: protein jag [Clostridia bacterium]|nr:protein jag [Clostridia bacterium]
MEKLIQGEFTGKTVEEAIKDGLLTLGLNREDAEVEVLEEGKKRLFGSVKARVRIAKKVTDGERAVDFLDELLGILDITATSELVSEEEKIVINITAANANAVIGKKGEVLDALQALAGAVANTGREDYRRVVVDCENYREEREASLKAHAMKLADKAVATGRKIRLDPMNPYERRIVHAALAAKEEVKTISEGKEPNRFIVIVPANYDPANDKRPSRKPYAKNGAKERRDGKPRERKEGEERRNDRPRGDRKPYDRNRRPEKKDQRKPAAFFGTYIGKNPNPSAENSSSEEK